MIDKQQLIDSIPSYKHTYQNKAEFSHVDSFNVVHNLQYLYYIEWARTSYLTQLLSTFNSEFYKELLPIMTVNHNVNIFDSLKFLDEYEVKTKVSKIGNSSIVFENLILKADNILILHSESTLVYVDFDTRLPKTFPSEIRALVSEFESW